MATGSASDRLVEAGVRVVTTLVVVTANLVGLVAVGVLVLLVLPTSEALDADLALANVVGVGGYTVASVVVATWLVQRRQRPARGWAVEGRDPTPDELRDFLRTPLHVGWTTGTGWLLGALLFGAANALVDAALGLRVALTAALAGATVAAVSFLLAERLLGPAARRALARTPLERPALPGVASRLVVSWLAVTAVPLGGLVAVGVHGLVDETFDQSTLALTTLVLGAIGLVLGLAAVAVNAAAIARPVVEVRRAMGEVADGRLDVAVDVDDASELGLLQAGFNEMAAGLRERERMRDLFGRHVGRDVARAALAGEGDVELGGEVREAAVLFVDLVGSTTLATRRPPEQVVELLNAFFAVVVDVVGEHGGWVNKFQGDAALAVFGPPGGHDDPAAAALSAARRLTARLASELPDVRAGVGVASGTVVAGNVGSRQRLEYTVIGDPVNTAARLTDLAKDHDPMLVADAATVASAGEDEAARWADAGERVLRGRATPTRLAVPRPSAADR